MRPWGRQFRLKLRQRLKSNTTDPEPPPHINKDLLGYGITGGVCDQVFTQLGIQVKSIFGAVNRIGTHGNTIGLFIGIVRMTQYGEDMSGFAQGSNVPVE